jgi:hypothetical protein
MPKGYPPTAFASSTCYDLNQVRADLKRFLESLGIEALLSETPSFPVTPESKTIENCVNAVKERADIFILILGGRYGSVDTSGKSITNLEYLAAKAKGIPIYVFVLKSILHILPVWKRNPQGDFTGVVDSTKLFEFIESLRDSKEHWVYAFEEVQHIIETLRHQIALLFMESLFIRDKFKRSSIPDGLRNLTGEALALVFEKPLVWEYKLFCTVLAAEIDSAKPLKWDLDYSLQLGRVIRLGEPAEISQWMVTKMHEIQRLVQSASKLMNEGVAKAAGPLGQPGNPEYLVYVARRLGEIYRAILEWTLEFNHVEVDPKYSRLVELSSLFSQDVIQQLESIPSRLDAKLTEAVEIVKTGKHHSFELMITLSVPPITEEFNREIKRLKSWF